jgi:hypothetical protein
LFLNFFDMTTNDQNCPNEDNLDIELSDEEFEKISSGLRAMKDFALKNKDLINNKSFTIKSVKRLQIKFDEGMMYNGAVIPPL